MSILVKRTLLSLLPIVLAMVARPCPSAGARTAAAQEKPAAHEGRSS